MLFQTHVNHLIAIRMSTLYMSVFFKQNKLYCTIHMCFKLSSQCVHDIIQKV